MSNRCNVRIRIHHNDLDDAVKCLSTAQIGWDEQGQALSDFIHAGGEGDAGVYEDDEAKYAILDARVSLAAKRVRFYGEHDALDNCPALRFYSCGDGFLYSWNTTDEGELGVEDKGDGSLSNVSLGALRNFVWMENSMKRNVNSSWDEPDDLGCDCHIPPEAYDDNAAEAMGVVMPSFSQLKALSPSIVEAGADYLAAIALDALDNDVLRANSDQCDACGRSSIDCSQNPCPAVIAEREEHA